MPTSNTHFVLLLGRVLRDNPRNANLEYALRASSDLEHQLPIGRHGPDVAVYEHFEFIDGLS